MNQFIAGTSDACICKWYVKTDSSGEAAFSKKVRACCSMCCMMRTYFRGGLVSIADEVGALEISDFFLNYANKITKNRRIFSTFSHFRDESCWRKNIECLLFRWQQRKVIEKSICFTIKCSWKIYAIEIHFLLNNATIFYFAYCLIAATILSVFHFTSFTER